jgi:hypothetical protein
VTSLATCAESANPTEASQPISGWRAASSTCGCPLCRIWVASSCWYSVTAGRRGGRPSVRAVTQAFAGIRKTVVAP